MITTPASKKTHWITLDKPKAEDGGDVLVPNHVFAAITPFPPSYADEEKISHEVRCDYHPDITMNTRIRLEDGTQLMVRGMQDIDLRHIELVLLCEEVKTP